MSVWVFASVVVLALATPDLEVGRDGNVSEFVLGAAFVVAPFALGFGGLARAVYALVGVGVMAIVALTDPGT